MKSLKIGRILMIALIIRLVLVPLSFHSDLNNNEIWGIYAQEFGLKGFYDWLNFGNYARPDYPPLAMILFSQLRWLWKSLFDILWQINIHVGVFPSVLVSWFDQYGFRAILKLPGIFSDIGIGYLIYYLVKKGKGEKQAKFISCLFLFNPAIIYLSSSWGQLDSVVSLFALVTLFFVLGKKYYAGLIAFYISVMIKATYIPLSVLLMIIPLKKGISAGKVLGLTSVLGILMFLLGSVFIDKNPLVWIINIYGKKILPGAVTLPYINLNAFNFWGFVFGLDRIADSRLFLGISLSRWAWSIGALSLILILAKFWKSGNVFFTASVLFFAIFMFFPRVHERYVYPFFVFFPIVLSSYPKLMRIFFLTSGIFLINLYHWWWFPEIGFLMRFFDSEIVERGLSLTNLILFIWLLKEYYRSSSKWTFR